MSHSAHIFATFEYCPNPFAFRQRVDPLLNSFLPSLGLQATHSPLHSCSWRVFACNWVMHNAGCFFFTKPHACWTPPPPLHCFTSLATTGCVHKKFEFELRLHLIYYYTGSHWKSQVALILIMYVYACICTYVCVRTYYVLYLSISILNVTLASRHWNFAGTCQNVIFN